MKSSLKLGSMYFQYILYLDICSSSSSFHSFVLRERESRSLLVVAYTVQFSLLLMNWVFVGYSFSVLHVGSEKESGL